MLPEHFTSYGKIETAWLQIEASRVDQCGNEVAVEGVHPLGVLNPLLWDDSWYDMSQMGGAGFWDDGFLDVAVTAGEGALRIDRAVMILGFDGDTGPTGRLWER